MHQPKVIIPFYIITFFHFPPTNNHNFNLKKYNKNKLFSHYIILFSSFSLVQIKKMSPEF